MSEQARLTEIFVSLGHNPDSLGWIQNMTLEERQYWVEMLGGNGSSSQQGMSNVEQQQQQQQASPPEGVSQDNPQPLNQPTAQAAQAVGFDVMDIDTAQAAATMDTRGRKRSRSPTLKAARSDSRKKRKHYRPVILPCTVDADGRATFPGPKTYVDKVKELRHGRFTLMEGQLLPTRGLETPRRRPRSRGPRPITF